jgi:hypothetical protein
VDLPRTAGAPADRVRAVNEGRVRQIRDEWLPQITCDAYEQESPNEELCKHCQRPESAHDIRTLLNALDDATDLLRTLIEHGTWYASAIELSDAASGNELHTRAEAIVRAASSD